ncbi:hypothetical protein M422DRAFT_260523 [Sphaerobolus stellatus SS14]|uniref:Uncharacterized protein n=1 Tax=Sphaerobolus stellatus (strain SS14) TaxID=990650 RepID=A0A0C9V6B0_SPHS4|nr:hypothetical protein M422DRAFT_260523 [Sphaerobolus stellatus SS14]
MEQGVQLGEGRKASNVKWLFATESKNCYILKADSLLLCIIEAVCADEMPVPPTVIMPPGVTGDWMDVDGLSGMLLQRMVHWNKKVLQKLVTTLEIPIAAVPSNPPETLVTALEILIGAAPSSPLASHTCSNVKHIIGTIPSEKHKLKTSPALMELGKPNFNVAKEHVMQEGMCLAQILTDTKAHDKHYKAHNALQQASRKPSLEPEKAPSGICGCGCGSTPKSNRTLICSMSLPTTAGVKMGNPPTYSSEGNLQRFENWVASVL